MRRLVMRGVNVVRTAVLAAALTGAASIGEAALDLGGLTGPSWSATSWSTVHACPEDSCNGDDDDYSPGGEETAREGVDIEDDEEPEEPVTQMIEV